MVNTSPLVTEVVVLFFLNAIQTLRWAFSHHAALRGPSWESLTSLSFVPQGSDAEYRFYTEFQSHEPEFDYLKSLEIEEKINQITWLRRRNVGDQLFQYVLACRFW